jgi:predicted P-loop ATPase
MYSARVSSNDRFDMEDAFTRHPFLIFDELVGLNRHSIDTWKSAMTDSKFLVRRPREEFAVNRSRIAVALATTNRSYEKGGFLQEGYGSRRFGCIELEDINWESYIREVDVNQMWAEALLLYQSSEFEWRFTRDRDFSRMEAYNLRYKIETDASRCVYLYFARPATDEEGEWMNPTEIISDLRKHRLLKAENLTTVTPRNIGITLTQAGYDYKKTRNGLDIPLQRYFVKRLYNNNIL